MTKCVIALTTCALIANMSVLSPSEAPETAFHSQTLKTPGVSLLQPYNRFNRVSATIVETHPELKESNKSLVLSDIELKDILVEAGFNGEALKMAWAVAMQESTGKPYAINNSSNCYGLFQINMTGSMGTDRREKYNIQNNIDLFNPLINAKVAYEMSNKGTDWSSWVNHKEIISWLSSYPN